MNLLKKYFIITLFYGVVLISGNVSAQALPIFLDGRFDDWTDDAVTYIDTENDGNQYDFKSFSVSNDENFLYIRFVLTPEVRLLESNNIALYIDGDNNASTGYQVNGIGAELRWNFGLRNGTFYRSGTTSIRYRHIKLRVLPTVTAEEHEIAIGRDVLPNNTHPLFSNDTIRIVFKDESSNGDIMPNTGEVFTYVFDDTPTPPVIPILLEKENEEALRVISYNVEFDGLVDASRKQYYERILNVIQPEIICFNEFFNTSAVQVRTTLNEMLPLGEGKSWYTIKLDAGNVTASRYPILQSWLVYSGQRITASLIDLSKRFDKNILVINAHFRCCSADEIRQREADATAAFFVEAQSEGGRLTLPEGTPIVLAGDLNLVGFSQQLKTLLTGDIVNTSLFGEGRLPDWDTTALHDLISMHSDKRTAYTWRSESSTYSPGRLDFMIYTNSVLDVDKSYILQTEVMPADRLNQYGLQQFDTRNASDHFPKVTDLLFKEEVTGVIETEPASSFILMQNYPNPFNPVTKIKFAIPSTHYVTLKVYNILGNIVATLLNEQKEPGNYEVEFDAEKLSSGIYFYQLSFNGLIATKKMLLLK